MLFPITYILKFHHSLLSRNIPTKLDCIVKGCVAKDVFPHGDLVHQLAEQAQAARSSVSGRQVECSQLFTVSTAYVILREIPYKKHTCWISKLCNYFKDNAASLSFIFARI